MLFFYPACLLFVPGEHQDAGYRETPSLCAQTPEESGRKRGRARMRIVGEKILRGRMIRVNKDKSNASILSREQRN